MKRMILISAAVMMLWGTGCRQAASTADIPAVAPFDVERYLGIWYEAARLPHRFEKGMTAVTAEYYRDKDGSVRVCNRGYRNGKIHSVSGYVRQKKAGTGELEVSFFRPFYGAYRIIALEKDYRAALVTSDTKDYAWILVREPAESLLILPKYLALLKQWGFDCSQMEYPAP